MNQFVREENMAPSAKMIAIANMMALVNKIQVKDLTPFSYKS